MARNAQGLAVALLAAGGIALGVLAGDARAGEAATATAKSASGGPYPAWLGGPDAPVLPQKFQRESAPYEAGAQACAAPAPPACANDPATYRKQQTRETCQAEIEAAVPKLFAYRQCMEGEVARHVVDFNKALAGLKCDARGASRFCP